MSISITILFIFLSIKCEINSFVSCVDNSKPLTATSLELKLVTLVHRHGDRSPLFFFPGDPYSDDVFWPDGKSQLLPAGKDRLYRLGTSLRTYYNEFLTNSPREVYSTSSDADRCIESAQMLLHGLYKATGRWRYNDKTDYLPIPIHTTPTTIDKMLAEGVICPVLEKESQAVFSRPGSKAFLSTFLTTLSKLSSHLGFPIDDLGMILSLYDPWMIEKSMNYSLPKWLTQSMLDDLASMVDLYSTIQNDSPVIHRLRAGPFFDNLRQNLLLATGTFVDNGFSKLKLLTYATHDTMLGSFMSALKVFNNKRVPYGATLLIELLTNPVNHSNHYVSLKYWNDTYSNRKHHLHLPFCSSEIYCPLDEFIGYIDQFIPRNWQSECGLSQNNSNIPDNSNNGRKNDYGSETWRWIGIVIVTCLSVITLIICILFVSFIYNLYRKSHYMYSTSNVNRSSREKQEYDRIL